MPKRKLVPQSKMRHPLVTGVHMFNKLTRLAIKVTEYCNLNCVYCHQLSGDKNSTRRFVLYDDLASFLNKCNFADIVQVTITGGEISLAIEELYKAIKMLRKIEAGRETLFKPNIVTNGSNWRAIIKALRQKIIAPEDITLSWDGIYSYSKTRQGKNNAYSDAHFNSNIEWIGANNLGNKINITYAITPLTVEDMYDSLVFALNAGVRNFSFYYIHEADYSNKAFKDKFADQLERIAALFVERYPNTSERFNYYNWQRIYTGTVSNNNFLSSITCKKLGNTLHFDTDGSIYGCIYFGDHKALQLGHLLDGGLYHERINKFNEEFFKQPSCNWQTCSLGFCFECPASNYVHNGAMHRKMQNTCDLLAIEKAVFDEYIKKITINKFDEQNWIVKDYEHQNHIEEKKQHEYTLPLANKREYMIDDKNITSENLGRVKNWLS